MQMAQITQKVRQYIRNVNRGINKINVPLEALQGANLNKTQVPPLYAHGPAVTCSSSGLASRLLGPV